MIKTYECIGTVGNTVITKIGSSPCIEDAWDIFEEYLKNLADILEHDDYEVLRVRTVVTN